VLVLNDAANDLGDVLANSFTASVNGSTVATSNTVNATIVEPVVTINKGASPLSGDAGDTITYTVTVTHPGGANTSDAFDVLVTDVLPAGLTWAGNVTAVTGPAPTVNTSALPTVTFSWATLPVGTSYSFTFDVTLAASVVPGNTFTNSATVTWTSLPGTGTTPNGTGSTTPGTSGAPDGERNGSGSTNDYTATDNAETVTVAGTFTAVKTIQATSETGTPETDPRPVAIGEILRYRLALDIPEGTSNNVQLLDTFSAGVALQDNTQVRVSFIADNDISEATDLSGADNDALPPTFVLPVGRITTVGQDVTFNLGTLVNNDNDANTETIVIEFNVLVLNDAANDLGDVLANSFTASANSGTVATSNTVDAVVAEPVLSIQKDASPLMALAGATATFTITVQNTGTADAQDVVISDTLPAGLTWVGNVTAISGPAPTVNTSALPVVTFSWSSVPQPPLGNYQFSFDVTIDPAATPGTAYANTAVMTWTSLPGTGTTTNPTGSTTPGGSGANNGERDGSGGTNDYTTSDSGTVTVPNVPITKTDALQVDVDGDATVDPGDTIRYTVVLTNSTGITINNAAFTDTPDANTALVVGSVTTSQGTVTTGNTAGDTNVAVNLGAFATGTSITITFDVVVDSPLANNLTTVSNQGFLAGDEIPNIPSNDSDTPARDDATVTPITGAPQVASTKTDRLIDANGDGVANSGDTLEYTVTITNTGTRDAENVVFTDSPDANTTLVVGSVTTTQGTVSIGNNPGDVGVVVNVGLVPGATGSVTIVFRVTINSPLVPPTVIQVANQGTTSGSNFADGRTDDSDTTAPTDATITPLITSPIIEAAKTDALQVDTNSNGQADPLDTVRYTVTLRNIGGVAATNVRFTDTPDANTTLVSGSVTTTAGTVTTGNTAGDTVVVVNVGSIASGALVTITFDVTINDPLPAGTSFVANQGLVEGDNFVDRPTDDSDTPALNDETITPIGNSPVLIAEKTDALVIDVNGNGDVNPGDTIEYTVVIRNAGTANADAVFFNDTPDANTTLVTGSVTTTQGTVTLGNTAGDTSVTVDVGTLTAGGGSVTIVFRVTVNSPLPAGTTQVSNQGLVTGSNIPDQVTDDSDTPAPNDTTTTPIGPTTQPSAVAAIKTDSLFNDVNGDGVPSPGDTLQYTILITNNSAAAVTGASFADTPDANTTLVTGSVTTTQGTVTLGNTAGDTSVGVNIGDILPGIQVTILFQVTINDPLNPPETQLVANQGIVSSPDIRDVPTDDTDQPGDDDETITVIGAVPYIESYKTVELTGDLDNNGAVNENDRLTYTITIYNVGNVPATNVVFSDTPDPNTTLIIGSVVVSDPAAIITQDTAVTVQLASLAQGASVAIEFQVRVNDPLPDGVTQVANHGVVRGDNFPNEPTDNPETPTDDDSTVIPVNNADEPGAPVVLVFDPAISKVGVLEDGGVGLPGEKLTWILTIINVGNTPGTDVVIADTVPSQLRVDAAAIDYGTYSLSGQTVTFYIPVLNPGQTVMAYIYTTVLSSPLSVDNTVTISGMGPDGLVQSDSASAHVEGVGSLPNTGYPPSEPEPTPAAPRSALPWVLGSTLLVGLALAGIWRLRTA